eukprot:COSAG06_NODE_2037_length_7766_cov_218.251989_4_plen_1365_part_00
MPPRKPPPLLCIGERNIPQRRTKDGKVSYVDKQCHVWEPVDESPGEQEHRYWAVICPSNMSSCRQCGKPIEKGTVRLGKPRKGSKGAGCPTGWYTTWFHVACCRAANDNNGVALTEKQLMPLIFANDGQLGTTALTATQIKSMVAELLKEEQPDCLKTVDPTDDAFMQLDKQLGLPKAKAPPGLQGKLLPFQAQGLGWMAAQEQSEYKGGILADEMGLGKTIQTIALLLEAKQRGALAKDGAAAKPKATARGRKAAKAAEAAEMCLPCSTTEDAVAPGPTLVVMPTSALHQWSEEISNFAGDNLRVLVYYGKKDRATPTSVLMSYDVILTTYPVAEIEWRLEENKSKVQCKYCNRFFTQDKLRDHNKYWCGPKARRTVKQRKTDKKGEEDGAAASTQSVNLGGHAFLDSVAAPDASLSAAAAKRNTRITKNQAKKKQKTESNEGDDDEEGEEEPSAALDPSGITDIYRGIMHSAGREAPGRWERINKARAQVGMARGTKRKKSVKSAAKAQDVKIEQEEEDAEDSEDSNDMGEGDGSSTEETEAEPELISAVGDVSVGDMIEIRDKPARSTSWYPAKVLSASSKGVKVHYIGWKSSYDEVVRPSTGRLRRKLDDEGSGSGKGRSKPAAAAAAGAAAAAVTAQKQKQGKGTAIKKEAASATATATKGKQQSKAQPSKSAKGKAAATQKPKKAAATAKKATKKAAKKAKKKKKKAGDSDEEDWEPKPIKVEGSSTSTRGRKRKTVSYAESGGSSSDSDSDSGSDASEDDDDSDSDEAYDSDEEEEEEEEEAVIDLEVSKPTLADGTPLPIEWDGIDLSASKLHSVVWGRIILDEAHKIKGRTTNVAKAIYSLRASYRWCLSGTPLQNNVGELYGLVKFLKMDPWAYYCCNMKGCDCKFMWWQFARGKEGKKCAACGHRSFFHFSYFNKNIIKPISNNGFSGTGRDAMLTIRNDVLQKIQLRRTKLIVQKDINLPPLTVRIVKLKLSTDERDFYEAIYKQSKLKFDSFGAKGTVLNNYAHIFDMLGRLRQACDHPYLIVHGSRHGQAAQLRGKTSQKPEKAGALCGICQDLVTEDDVAVAGCKHVFHNACIGDYVTGITMDDNDDGAAAGGGGAKAKAKKKPKKPVQPGCPVCYKPLTITLDPSYTQKTEEQIRKDAAAAASNTGESSGGRSGATKAGGKTKKAAAGKAKGKAQAKGGGGGGRGTKRTAAAAAAAAEEEEEEEEDDNDEDSEDEEAELQRALLMSMEDEDVPAATGEPAAAAGGATAGAGAAMMAAGGDDDSDSDSEDEGGESAAAAAPLRRPRRPAAAAAAAAASAASGLKIGRSNFLHRIDMEEFTSSSKLNALIDAIVKTKKKSPDHKSIVFSQ